MLSRPHCSKNETFWQSMGQDTPGVKHAGVRYEGMQHMYGIACTAVQPAVVTYHPAQNHRCPTLEGHAARGDGKCSITAT